MERERERERWFVQTYLNLFQTLQILRKVFQGMNWVVLMIVYDIILPSAEIGDQGNKPKSSSRKHRLLKRSSKFVRWIFPWQYIHRSRMCITRVMDKPLVRYDGNRNWTSLNGRGLVCTRGQGPHLYTRTRDSSVHAEWVCCMYHFVLTVV